MSRLGKQSRNKTKLGIRSEFAFNNTYNIKRIFEIVGRFGEFPIQIRFRFPNECDHIDYQVDPVLCLDFK